MIGVAASPGINIGKVFILDNKVVEIEVHSGGTIDYDFEVQKFKASIVISRKQLEDIIQKVTEEMGEEEAQIFSAHLSLLEDPVLEESVLQKIKDGSICAEAAIKASVDELCMIFESMDDEYMRERAADIKDIGNRILRNMTGTGAATLEDLQEQVIVVAHDLTPSETATMKKEMVLGIATDVGGKTSHTAIIAKMLEIPAVVGLGSIVAAVKNGDTVIIDGVEGKVLVNPSQEQISEYEAKRKHYIEHKAESRKMKDLPAVSQDGRKVEILANIGNVHDAEGVLEKGGEGIGLFRSEFLYMDRAELPSEEEQFGAYKAVLDKMQGKPVVIRTLDIGGDKQTECIHIPQEMNPFLGWRAIRICLDMPEIIKTQLRAILRASNFGKAMIMYPMIISITEIRRLNAILQGCKEELKKENKPFDEHIQVGIMIETPAAAIMADKLAREVDFFSIGTNDLTQYSLAVDRGNERINSLYNSGDPAVLRFIKMVIDASHAEGKWTGICGELAGDELYSGVLLGMGVDELSMSAASIAEVKNVIRNSSFEQMKATAEKVLSMESADEVTEFLKSLRPQE